MHEVALPHFYRDVRLIQSEPRGKRLHDNLFSTLSRTPNLGYLVRSLDVCKYQLPLGASVLPKALLLLPRLRSIRLQLEELASLDREDAFRLFFGLPDLEGLWVENTDRRTDPSSLASVFMSIDTDNQSTFSNINSLTLRSESGSFHSWPPQTTPFIDSRILSKFLLRFPKLRSLDLAHTAIDPQALFDLSSSARLQNLRISHCQDDTSTLARFLATHTAVRDTLGVFDGAGIEFSKQDTSSILENLPSTLRSLNLSSSLMDTTHIPTLQKHSRYLKELTMGYGLSMENIEAVLLGSNFKYNADDTPRSTRGENTKEELGHEIVLGPMRNAIAVCRLGRRLASVSPLASGAEKGSRIRYLDLSCMDAEEQGRIASSVLLGEEPRLLERIVVSGIVGEGRGTFGKVCGAGGWREMWVGGMTWIERT